MAREKAKTYVHVYLLLCQGDELLLSLRQNTGYEDGNFGLVAGHVETGESATNAMVREAKEEIGICLIPDDLEVVHTMYRRSDRENVDFFLTCRTWTGSIANCEPERCASVQFFPKTALPENTVEYVKLALEHIAKGVRYSEVGWQNG